MTDTDLQLGGGYMYQWECAILLALNYFFDPLCYDQTLFALVTEFLGGVSEIHLEGKSRESGIDLEDINFFNDNRRILIQVKTKQAEGSLWTVSDSSLLNALYKFYTSAFLADEPDTTRFVFLTNRPLNRDLVKIREAIKAGELEGCAKAGKLLRSFRSHAEREGNEATVDEALFFQLLSHTALVDYLDVDQVKANIQAKLQSFRQLDWERAHHTLFEYFARQSTRQGGSTVTRESILEALGSPLPLRDSPTVLTEPVTRFAVPFPDNPDFFGREVDLTQLHKALQGEGQVDVRPVGLTGMGGIGKTQLAVQYAYRHVDAYPDGVFWIDATESPAQGFARPDGVFWIDATESLAQGFARLGTRLHPAATARPRDEQILVVANYLQSHPHALLIVDDVADPAVLNRPLSGDLVPAALPCCILFTTRCRDIGRFTAIKVTMLPKEAALQLLLSYPNRREILKPDHQEHEAAGSICAILGYLPLALEIASAHLGRQPNSSPDTYRRDLLTRGALKVLDDKHGRVREEDLGTRHKAAVAATLESQWETVENKDARLLLRVAGQLPKASSIPVARLGLLAGLDDCGEETDYFGSSLEQALRELEDASLLERLRESQEVRLHPLVREFAARQTLQEEVSAFVGQCAANLFREYEDIAVLEEHTARRGVEAVRDDIFAAWSFAMMAGSDLVPNYQELLLQATEDATSREDWTFADLSVAYEPLNSATTCAWQEAWSVALNPQSLLLLLMREYQNLRKWERKTHPAFFAQQIYNRAVDMRLDHLAAGAVARLVTLGQAHLSLDWCISCDSPASDRTLADHEDQVLALAVTPDRRHVISTSKDGTLKIRDLQTGQEVRSFTGHKDWVNTVALTPDGRLAIAGHCDGTLRVWDLQADRETLTLTGHTSGIITVVVTPDGRHVISVSEDGVLKVWNLQTGQEMHTIALHKRETRAVAVMPDGQHAISPYQYAYGTTSEWNYRFNLHFADRHPCGALKVWEIESGRAVCTLAGHESWVHAVAVTPDGRHAISACADSTLKVWDVESGSEVRTLAGHKDWVNAVAVTPDGENAISASCDCTLIVWNLLTGQEVAKVVLKDELITVVIADSSTVLVGDAGWNLYRLKYVGRKRS